MQSLFAIWWILYWPSFFGQGGWTLASISVHKNAKRELGQYPAILTSCLVNNAYLLMRSCEWKGENTFHYFFFRIIVINQMWTKSVLFSLHLWPITHWIGKVIWIVKLYYTFRFVYVFLNFVCLFLFFFICFTVFPRIGYNVKEVPFMKKCPLSHLAFLNSRDIRNNSFHCHLIYNFLSLNFCRNNMEEW